jgi:malonyl-CoA O-methyltransferase
MTGSLPLVPLRQAYDRWSAVYDTYDNPMVSAATEIVAGIAPMAEGRHVLELGCGTGRNLLVLSGAGAESVTGCDLSAGMLAAARRKAPMLSLVSADVAGSLPFADGVADVVLFCLVLEHVAALSPPLREARRILRPGGRVVIVEIHPDLAAQGVAAHFRDREEVVHMPTFAHRLEDFAQAATEAGLRVERSRAWRPCDFAVPHPKMRKRDRNGPFALEMLLEPVTAATGP